MKDYVVNPNHLLYPPRPLPHFYYFNNLLDKVS